MEDETIVEAIEETTDCLALPDERRMHVPRTGGATVSSVAKESLYLIEMLDLREKSKGQHRYNLHYLPMLLSATLLKEVISSKK